MSGHSASASAPGKIIITGEHFVVHGSYALAAAINKRATVKVSGSSGHPSEVVSGGKRSEVSSGDGLFNAPKAVIRKILRESGKKDPIRVEISSEIPPGSGLGSSAAISLATAAALSSYFGQDRDIQRISDYAQEGEREVHGNPSGIDTATSLHGGIILFDKESGVKPLSAKNALRVLVVFSGKARRTSELVAKVKGVRTRYPALFDHLAKAATLLSLEAAKAIEKDDLPRLGALLNLNQASLSWLGVSTPALDKLINKILGKDVHGAKLTGAGGGGSVIAIPSSEREEDVLREISKTHKFSFLSSIPQEGLRWES